MGVISNSFIKSVFNYGPLFWPFDLCTTMKKRNSQKRCPRIIHNDYESGKISIHKNCLRMILTDYDSDYETPLEKNGKPNWWKWQ